MEAIDIYLGESQEDGLYFYKNDLWALDLDKFDVYGELQKFAGCCGNAVWTNIPYGEDIEKSTKVLSEILATNKGTDYGFGAVFCTVTEEEQLIKLQECGWKLLCDHTNYGTGNIIYTLRLV